jgi:hypothetical protein
MKSFEEVQAAARELPKSEQQKLFNYLLMELEPQAGAIAPPRELSKEQIEQWIAADEEEWAKIKASA